MTKARGLGIAILSAVTLAAGTAWGQATNQSCVSGSDCLCDRMKNPSDPIFNPNVILCEDFEDPALSPAVDQGAGWISHTPPIGGTGFNAEFAYPSGNCFSDANGPADQKYTINGTCPTCCYNVIQPGVGCDSPGTTNCLFDGGGTLGRRIRPGSTSEGGGNLRFTRSTSTFGITYAMRYSNNALVVGPAWKHNEIGRSASALLGMSGGNVSQNVPFDTLLFLTNPESRAVTMRAGRYAPLSTSIHFSTASSGSGYEFNVAKTQWYCHQAHITNLGAPNGRYRYWVTPLGGSRTLLIDADVDLTGGFSSASGTDQSVDHILLNSYYNGPDCPTGVGPGCGNPLSENIYRYEDNIVVTSETEPVACSAIGFASPAASQLGAPGKPYCVSCP